MTDAPESFVNFFPHARSLGISNSIFNVAGRDFTIQQQPAADLQAYLQPINDASHTRNRKTSPPDSVCTDGTRTPVISLITAWAQSSVGPNDHVFILTGYAGSGKSAISQTVSVVFHRAGRLGASFFFHQASADRSVMTKFTATLASQLAVMVPEMAPYMLKALRSTPDLLLPATSLDVQLESLIFSPFKEACHPGTSSSVSLPRPPITIVVDGLDECQDASLVDVFMDSIRRFFNNNPFVPLRFFIATRMEFHIARTFSSEEVVQYDLGSHNSNDDINIYFRASFSPAILKRYRVIQSYIQEYKRPWPEQRDLCLLSCHAKGSFRLAVSMVQFILDTADDDSTPIDRLPQALQMELNLDGLYSQTFSRSHGRSHFFDIISTMTLLNYPLSTSALAEILGLPVFKVLNVLLRLQAFIQVPDDIHKPVTFCYSSLREYFRSEERSGHLYVSPAQQLMLSYRCFLRNRLCGPMSDPRRRTAADAYCLTNCTAHWHFFVSECKQGHVEEIESFSQGPAFGGMSRHAFLSSLFVWELFHLGSEIEQSASVRVLHPLLLSYIFTEWTRHLALAVEEGPDDTITTWLNQPIGQVIQCSPVWGRRSFQLSEAAFEAFQANIQSAWNVVENKQLASGSPFPLQRPGTLSDVNKSLLAPWTQTEINNYDGVSKTLSPLMVITALDSIGSRSDITNENGSIRLEFCVILKSGMAETPILLELYDEPEDIEEEFEEVEHFLDSQPDPDPHARYRYPDQTLHI